MLDRIAAAIERALQADAVVGVAGHFFAPAVRFVHDGFQLFERKRGLRDEISLFIHPRAMRHVHLDPIRSVIELLARGLARFHRPVHELRAFGHIELRRITFEVVSARAGDGARGDEEPRPGNGAFFDGLLDFHIAVARALGFDVAQRGESLLERAADSEGGARGAQRDSGVQDVRIVAALGGVFTPEKNVRVRIDEAGKHNG